MAGAEVTDSSLDRSIVFPDAEVHDCDIDETILGENVHVEGYAVTRWLWPTVSSYRLTTRFDELMRRDCQPPHHYPRTNSHNSVYSPYTTTEDIAHPKRASRVDM